MITSAFTCTGPYAILILLGIKRTENRSVRPIPDKGRCAISCSKSFSKEKYGNFIQWASRALTPEQFELLPAWRDVKDWPGTLVGVCDYEVRERNDLRLESGDASFSWNDESNRWDEGFPYWWDLSNVVVLEHPIPCRGSVGMWRLPQNLGMQIMTCLGKSPLPC